MSETNFPVAEMDERFYGNITGEVNKELSLRRNGNGCTLLALNGHIIPGQCSLEWEEPCRGVRKVTVWFELQEEETI